MLPVWLIVWAVGALLVGFFMIWKMSGRKLSFKTDDWMFLLAVTVLSIVWPIYLPYVGLRAIRSRA